VFCKIELRDCRLLQVKLKITEINLRTGKQKNHHFKENGIFTVMEPR